MTDKYENPIELTLVKINGQYWALNDDDSDNQFNTESDFSHIGREYKVDMIGYIKIPHGYFGNNSEPYIA